MNKKALTWIVVLGVLAIVVIWGVGRYNAIITAEENVNTAWSQVENQYQRRADLIPNLVATVKGYAEHEGETLESVVNARAKATQTTLDINNFSREEFEKYQAAQGELNSALGRLMMITENYPELKADKEALRIAKDKFGTSFDDVFNVNGTLSGEKAIYISPNALVKNINIAGNTDCVEVVFVAFDDGDDAGMGSISFNDSYFLCDVSVFSRLVV